MSKNRDEQIQNVVKTLSRIRKGNPQEYADRIRHYHDMVQGGDGGPWREGADSSIRELHYPQWLDEDFQTILESLDEVETLSEEERAERFAHERGIWNKLKKALGS